MTTDGPFTAEDLKNLSELAIATWESGLDRDWSVPAGTLEWSCHRTAAHTVDSVFAPAFFLASQRQAAYPKFDNLRASDDATVPDLIDGLRAVTTMLWAVIVTCDPDVRAIIRRRPVVEIAGPQEFAPRGALELILHTFDIATGLDIPFDPPRDLCSRLFTSTDAWPREQIERTDDSWSDLLASRGRPRA